MSIQQLDDSEFLEHVVWLVEGNRTVAHDVVTRLRQMADRGPRTISSADYRSHLLGDTLTGRAVTLRMSKAGAEAVSLSLSDLLCWCRGFVAAIPEDLSRHPLNWEAAREINIALKRAIEDAEKEQKP